MHASRLAIITLPAEKPVPDLPDGTELVAVSRHLLFDRHQVAVKVRHPFLPAIGDGATIPRYTLGEFVAAIRHWESNR